MVLVRWGMVSVSLFTCNRQKQIGCFPTLNDSSTSTTLTVVAMHLDVIVDISNSDGVHVPHSACPILSVCIVVHRIITYSYSLKIIYTCNLYTLLQKLCANIGLNALVSFCTHDFCCTMLCHTHTK